VFIHFVLSGKFNEIFPTLGFLSFAFVLIGCAGYAAPSPKASVQSSGIVVSPGNFDFKSVAVGQTMTQTMTIKNTNKVAIQILALSVSSKQFAVSGPSVPRSILPGMTAQYTLAFAPSTSGDSSGSISIMHDQSRSPISITIGGRGTKNSAALQLAPTSISFGDLALRTTSTQNVTLQNTGDVNVSINGVSVVGAGFGYADLSPGYSLSPNQKVTFQVWFKPQVKGSAAGTLSILAANVATPITAMLSGNGVVTSGSNPTPSPTPTSHSVHLTWNASSSSNVGYRLYRSEAPGGPYVSVNGSNIESLSYDDGSVSSGNTYYYVVTAVNSAGQESVYSNQTSAAIPSN
jgi:Transmembrane protein 131-like N-terminal/Abnormal spindle-like microcephaly-assoc'd, ASPM-SPD-2-Hydin